MSRAINDTETLDGTYVFDGEKSRQGFRLNRFCMTLTSPENREAFKADEEAFMAKYSLSEEERAMIRARDWYGLTKYGGNIYMVMKIGGCVGHSLAHIGAQCRGETLEEFLATRKHPGAR